jgi:D-aminoacyl-tRNA deacylase
MKVVIQRVSRASVKIEDQVISNIKNGLLVLVGLKTGDTEDQFDYIIQKILNLRIFPDSKPVSEKEFNVSVRDCNYEVLLVSQFTLYASCKKGNRPSFSDAMKPQDAEVLYSAFVKKFKETYSKVFDGKFGAMMQVELVNNGPVTIVFEK